MNRLIGIFATFLLSGVSLATLPTSTVAGERYSKHHEYRGHDYGRHHRYWHGYEDDYYPRYRRYNPVVSRDYYSRDHSDWDGTFHSEDVVEDRRASFYDPGRNEAITRPHTTVDTWNESPNRRVTREHTSWIGADGRPHSTTIDRETTTDRWGDTHTDTHVTLKQKKLK